MQRLVLFVSVGIVAIISAACTSLSSKQINGQTNTPPGLTYRLPAKQFTVKAEYQITGCSPRGTNADLAANVTVSLSESLIGAEAYTIDYEQLNAWTKVTSTEFQLSQAGLLTGVNATISDQSGAVIGSSVSGITSIVRAATLPNIPAIAKDNYAIAVESADLADFKIGSPINRYQLSELFKIAGESTEKIDVYSGSKVDADLQRSVLELIDPCHPIKLALEEKKQAKEKLESEKAKDKTRTKLSTQLTDSQSIINALKDLVDTYEKLGDEVEKEKLLHRIQLQVKTVEEINAQLLNLGDSQTEKMSENLVKAMETLTVADSFDFVPTKDDTSKKLTVSGESLKKLTNDRLNAESIHLPILEFTIKPILESTGQNSNLVPIETGIAYRIPVAARANILIDKSGTTESSVSLLDNITQVPQFGPIGSIDLNNRIFDDNLIELAFNSDTGAPSRLKFLSKSKAEAAAASLRDAGNSYYQAEKEKIDDQIAANKALTDQATANITLQKASSNLDLTTAQDKSAAAKALAEYQQTLITTQTTLLREQQRLEAVRTGTATTPELELEALKTQEELLNQKLKIMKLEYDIQLQKNKAVIEDISE